MAAKKSAAKKSAAKSAKGSAAKKPTKYGPKAHEAVEREMEAFKEGTLRSSSGAKVTNPKQAIAIGLSEARRAGGKVPPVPAK